MFSANGHTYNPQGLTRGVFQNSRPAKGRKVKGAHVWGLEREHGPSEYGNYPRNILSFANPNHDSAHPTQKPVALYEYLIRTYTNEGDTVLDFCMGSGTTGVAAVNTGRSFVGVELDAGYFAIAQRRIADAQAQLALPILEVAAS